MKRLHDLRVRTKLFIAYGLFILPVVFLCHVIVDKSFGDIDFARKELLGTPYVVALRQVQDAVLRGGTGAPAKQLAERLAAAEKELGEDMGTADLAAAAVVALTAPARLAARAALRDLIGKVTDGSNLTLDPDLDSFYVMDATTGKITEALDRLYGIAQVTAGFAGKAVLTADEQADFLVQEGSLVPVLDGVGTSLNTAFKANDRVREALDGPLRTAQGTAKSALAALRAAALDDRSGVARAAPAVLAALTDLASLGTASATELGRLLDARIAGFRTSLLIDFAIAAALFVAGVGFILVAIQSGVVGPLGRLTGLMRRLTNGDLEVTIPVNARRDEIGEMAQVLTAFKKHAIENNRLNEENARDQAARGARQAAMDRHTQDFGTSVSGVMATMVLSAEVMREAARAMSEAAARTRDSTSGAVEDARISSRDLNSVAVAAEQMGASIIEISRQVAHVTASVRQAVERAAETDAKVAGLADAADRIGDVVSLITEIAGQTNLLALNATIEAARAGDAGRGFAVVAHEVKALAAQTARATDRIGIQIVAIRGATGEAVDAVREVSQAIGQVESVATAIAAAVEQQAAATQEISGSVRDVTTATSNVSQTMEFVLTIAERTDTASRSVLAAAADVGHTADILRAEVSDFLTAMTGGDAGEQRPAGTVPTLVEASPRTG